MGLTRERWCCARGWLSRLDMKTCQTSIKTDILLLCLGSPHLGYQKHEASHVVHYRTEEKGVVKRTNTSLSNTYHMKLRKLSQHPIGQNILFIYPQFRIEFVQPPRFLNSEGSETITLDRFPSSLLNIFQTFNSQLCIPSRSPR